MKKYFVLSALFILWANFLFSQEPAEPAEPAEQPKTIYNNPHYIGFHAGISTGTGLAYRYFDGWGIQIAFLPIVADQYRIISVGVTGFKSLLRNNWFNFFLYSGVSYANYYQQRLYYGYGYYSYPSESTYSSSTSIFEENVFGVGVGPGVEFSIVNRVSFDIMIGYGFFLNNGRFRVNPTIEVGAFFRL